MNVSVVIPTHNRSDLLVRAVESVLNQTHKELEVIIVSDGSTDDTDTVINQLKNRDNRVKSISYHPAKGANTARNKGIEAAQYSLVAFLDDDDEWYQDKLESQINVIKSNEDIGLVYTGKSAVYVNENITYSIMGKAQGDLSKEILKRNVIGTTSTVLVKKEILEEVGGFDIDLPAAQDYDLWIRASQITKVGVVPEEKLYYYNYTDKKQISSNIERYEHARQVINNKYHDLFSTLSSEDKRSINANIAISRTNLALRNKQKKTALKYLIKSIKIKPNKKNIVLLLIFWLPYKYILKLRSVS